MKDPFSWLCHLAEQCIVDGHRHFAAGKRDRAAEDSDLIPYWIYTLKDGAKIERHVPALPLRTEIIRHTPAYELFQDSRHRLGRMAGYVTDGQAKTISGVMARAQPIAVATQYVDVHELVVHLQPRHVILVDSLK